MAKDILKEAIADAKAVREVALANAKAALEEAFTPRLQSMLSAKLSEELEEDTLEETEGMEPKEDMDEIMEPMKEDMDETMYDEDMDEMGMDEELDEEVDLEEILAELELEESEIAEVKKDDDLDEAKDEDLDEAKDEDLDEAKDKDLDEAKDDDDLEEASNVGKANPKHDDVKKASPDYNIMNEDKEFDLDALLEEINNLGEEEEPVDEIGGMLKKMGGKIYDKLRKVGQDLMLVSGDDTFDKNKPESEYKRMSYPMKGGEKEAGNYDSVEDVKNQLNKYYMVRFTDQLKDQEWWTGMSDDEKATSVSQHVDKHHGRQLDYYKANYSDKFGGGQDKMAAEMYEMQKELDETKAALEVKTTELNEVNLLNSKLLYVNRIFKANTLNEAQKLRVVESLDNASNVKEAKLIYETIKDSFNIVGKTKKKKTIKEGFGMASKAAGTSTAPKKEVISESNNMVARFQKLANIQINE